MEQASAMQMQTFVFLQRMVQGNGGARRDRTDDLKLAKLPLSQLSYGPVFQNRTTQPRDKWWAEEDLNFRPHDYQSCALTN